MTALSSIGFLCLACAVATIVGATKRPALRWFAIVSILAGTIALVREKTRRPEVGDTTFENERFCDLAGAHLETIPSPWLRGDDSTYELSHTLGAIAREAVRLCIRREPAPCERAIRGASPSDLLTVLKMETSQAISKRLCLAPR